MEIERQFLVKSLPELPAQYESISQGYVALLPEIRIRQIDESRYILTVKRGDGLVREEWETRISKAEFENLSKRLQTDTVMIRKLRYRIPLTDALTAELHVHEGHLKGFNYVEVEFPAEDEARAFIPPAWFGREVTDDADFSYRILAQPSGMDRVKELLGGS